MRPDEKKVLDSWPDDIEEERVPMFPFCIYRRDEDGYCYLRDDPCPGYCTEFDGSEGEDIPDPPEPR